MIFWPLNYISIRWIKNYDLIKFHFKLKCNEFWGTVVYWLWCHGVIVTTTAQLHSTNPELRFCAGSNSGRGMSEIRDGENLWQWCWLEIRLIAFRRSTIPQKQFITIIRLENQYRSLKLTHFSPVSHFCTSWKRHKTFGIEMWYWTNMG